MSRPKTHADITGERHHELGYLETEQFLKNPVLLKAYATFAEAFQKSGGEFGKQYTTSSIKFLIPKTHDELEEQLALEQERWDRMERIYDACQANGTKPESYEEYSVKEWARKEGFPLPWSEKEESY